MATSAIALPWTMGQASALPRQIPRPLIAFDPQHLNKPARPWDVGAGFDLDQDGEIEAHEREAAVVLDYVAASRAALAVNRIPVVDGFSGNYAARNRHADAIGARLYLACHVNAGGGDYGMIGVDYRSPPGSTARRVAAAIAREWRASFGHRVKLLELRPDGSRAQRNGYATISSCQTAALLLEPLFLDGPGARLAPANRPTTIRLISQGIDLGVRRSMTMGAL